MHKLIVSLIFTAALMFGGRAEAAEKSWTMDALDRGIEAAEQTTWKLAGWAERAVILGGMVVYQNRHTISGAAIGCVTGAAVSGSSAVALGVATGGAALAAGPQAVAIGCGLGSLAGASLGYQLDHAWDQ